MQEEIDPVGAAAIHPAPMAAPIASSERIAVLDVLRGFALLGILVINIEVFAYPSAVYFDPRLIGGFAGLDLFAWKLGSYFFFQKMMAIFSMLFGAGFVLMVDRWESRGLPARPLFYRRSLILLAIGLLHAYLLWHGDILVAYALCAMLLYLFRRRSPRALIVVAIVVLAVGTLIQLAVGFQFSLLRSAAEDVASARAQGETVEHYQEIMADAWPEIDSIFSVSPQRLESEITAYRGGYGAVFLQRAPEALMMQIQGFPFYTLWRSLGMMLLGMALLKIGVLTGMHTNRYYAVLAVLGYGIGLPLTIVGTESMIARDFDFVNSFLYSNQLQYVGSILVSLAHVAVILLICKAGFLQPLQARLAAVGRLALSNYLLQSLLCTTLFYGYGFGLFARLSRIELLGVVVGVWIISLLVSPWWLKRFQFGPAEWVWRALTYGKRPPFRLSARSLQSQP